MMLKIDIKKFIQIIYILLTKKNIDHMTRIIDIFFVSVLLLNLVLYFPPFACNEIEILPIWK